MAICDFVSVSELSKDQPEVFKRIEEGKRLAILRNNRLQGYMIGVNDPLARFLNLETPDDKELDAERFFEITLAKPWRESFMSRYGGLEPADGTPSIDRLLGLEGSEVMRELPFCDHYTLWCKNGEPVLFTMHVYDLSMEDYRALRDFCVKHGLTYKTERRSWYLPSVSTLLVISRDRKN